MFDINLGTAPRKMKASRQIVHSNTKPVTLTAALDNLATVSLTFNDNNIHTLTDIVNTLTNVNSRYTEELAIFKVVDMIISICNNPGLSTDYSYLVTMLKNMREDWGYNGEDKNEAFVTTVKIEKMDKPNMSILEVLVTLLNVLGYEQTIIVVKTVTNYDFEF